MAHPPRPDRTRPATASRSDGPIDACRFDTVCGVSEADELAFGNLLDAMLVKVGGDHPPLLAHRLDQCGGLAAAAGACVEHALACLHAEQQAPISCAPSSCTAKAPSGCSRAAGADRRRRSRASRRRTSSRSWSPKQSGRASRIASATSSRSTSARTRKSIDGGSPTNAQELLGVLDADGRPQRLLQPRRDADRLRRRR